MSWDKNSRRHFLKGLGGFTLTLPILPSLIPREARGAQPFKKRFIAIHSGHCQAVEHWLPDHSKFTFTQQGAYAREVNLTSITGEISPVLGAAFSALKPKINLLARLDPLSTQPNHNAEVILSGGVKSEFTNSLDQVLASRLYQGSPLNLYVRSVFDQYYSGASHVSVANGNYSPGQFNPSAVFSSLFGSGGSGTDTRMQRRDLAVVDRVFNEFKALRQSKNISKSDALRLEEHLALIAQTESKLKQNLGTNSTQCGSPIGPMNSPVISNQASDYQVVIDQMFDVLEVGIKCGKVQVATLMLHAYDYFSGSIGFIQGINGSVRMHEDVCHAGNSELRAMKLSLNKWFGERVARFLKNLDVVEDATTNSTYLDHSLILWANDQGTTQNTNAHASVNSPVLLAGSAGGFIKTGKYVDYGPAYAANITRAIGGDEGQYLRGRPYNQLLITIAQAMGLAPSDYESANAQGFGVYGGRLGQYSYLPGNHRRETLPVIT